MLSLPSTLFSAFVFTALAMSSPLGSPQVGNSQCDTGSLNCCSTVQTPQAYAQSAGLGGVVSQLVGSIEGNLGVSCTTLDIVGASGNDCSAQPACCTGSSFNGLVTLGCTPVNLNV